jgi:hypothetical protein
MYRVSKLLQELFRKEFGDRGDIGTGALVALEWWFVRAVENEDGVDGEGDQTKEAIVEGSQRRICAAWSLLAFDKIKIVQAFQYPTFTRLYLEEPYRCINSDAQRSAGLFELLDGEFRESYALPGADLFVNTTQISIHMISDDMRNLPVNSHHDHILDAIVCRLPCSWCCALQ